LVATLAACFAAGRGLFGDGRFKPRTLRLNECYRLWLLKKEPEQ